MMSAWANSPLTYPPIPCLICVAYVHTIIQINIPEYFIKNDAGYVRDSTWMKKTEDDATSDVPILVTAADTFYGFQSLNKRSN